MASKITLKFETFRLGLHKAELDLKYLRFMARKAEVVNGVGARFHASSSLKIIDKYISVRNCSRKTKINQIN